MSNLHVVTYLFFLNAEYIMQNERLYEAQAGIKIARRNINDFRYADDITLMEEREEKLKRLFSSLLSAIRGSSAYLRLLILLPVILIPACASYSPAFLMIYSA